jgi:hypothetical protein
MVVTASQSATVTLRAAAAASSSITIIGCVGVIAAAAVATVARVAGLLSASTNGDRHALGNATVIVTSRILSIVEGKVSADQVSPHGGIFLSKNFILTNGVCLVLSVVHPDNASIARRTRERFIGWFRPAAATAQTSQV